MCQKWDWSLNLKNSTDPLCDCRRLLSRPTQAALIFGCENMKTCLVQKQWVCCSEAVTVDVVQQFKRLTISSELIIHQLKRLNDKTPQQSHSNTQRECLCDTISPKKSTLMRTVFLGPKKAYGSAKAFVVHAYYICSLYACICTWNQSDHPGLKDRMGTDM